MTPDIEATNDPEVLRRWIGRTETRVDALTPERADAIEHTLDRPAGLRIGDPMPALRHFQTHVGSVPTSELGADGHPRRGGFWPPVALPRRMWASSEIAFEAAIRIGDEIEKTSTIRDIAFKDGRTGKLCFVTVEHEHRVNEVVAIRERQNIVYRDDPDPAAEPPPINPAPDESDWSRTVVPEAALLFRYSALTFNAHRIHYDRGYARDVEGYDGLVVHGPLLATQLADLVTDETGRPIESFAFRGVAPMTDQAPYSIHGTRTGPDSFELWTRRSDGAITMQATGTLSP